MKIITNVIICNACDARVESQHRHDFNAHGCAGLEGRWFAADGGRAYLRRVGSSADWREASHVEHEPV